jgi:lipooligosaccharide transport system ATP-binding protein
MSFMPPVVIAKNLLKKYKDTFVVDGIDLQVQENEFFGLIGPNGAGKTSTLKMVYCFSPRSGGELSVLGKDPALYPEAVKAELGVVPQDNNLDTDLNVFENLTSYARYFDIAKPIALKRSAELLEFVQLSEKAKTKVDELSSGMRRRLLIARGLINSPRLLILDEPTVGLDPQARHLIWDKLRDLKKQNASFILTTHYMDEAAQLCDRLAIMDKGKILAVGTPGELVSRYVGDEVLEVVVEQGKNSLKADVASYSAVIEETGSRSYLYCRDCRLLLEGLVAKGYQSVMRRPATLEDVFLRLTGRDLVD